MSHPYHISIPLVIITILSSYYNCTVWSGVLLDADLSFIFTQDDHKQLDVKTDFPYFEVVRNDNPYTPLRHLVLNQSILSKPTNEFLNQLKEHGYHNTEKSPRPKVIFVNLVGSARWEKNFDNLIMHAGTTFRQDFVFGHFHSNNDLQCLQRHPKFVGTLKLVLFKNSVTSPLFVPCLTCELMSFSIMKTFTLLGILEAWDTQNKDLHKYLTFLGIPVQGSCSPLQDTFVNIPDMDFCPVATITERYNLTLLQYKPGVGLGGDKSFLFALVIVANYDNHSEYRFYDINLRTINFITITNHPSPVSGVATFISPFDLATWICLFTIITAVAGLLTFLGFRGEIPGACVDNGSMRSAWISRAVLMVEKVITVTFIFLGYIGESPRRSYRNRKVALVLTTLWLFGNLVLMVNYYQGTIYSYLTVIFPPPTPRGVEDLIRLDVPILAMDRYVTNRGFTQTYLNDIVLPQLISSSAENHNFKKFLTKFQSKLLSARDNSVFKILKIMKQNSTRGYPMVVIFVFRDLFKTYQGYVKFLGNQHVVRNNGDSPFHAIFFKIGNKNLFTPYLAKGLRSLQESGLTEMWSNMNSISAILSFKERLLALGKYFAAVQESFGNVREPVTFHESNDVPLNLISPAFSLSAVMVAFALVGFAIENLKFVTNALEIVSTFMKRLVQRELICTLLGTTRMNNIVKQKIEGIIQLFVASV